MIMFLASLLLLEATLVMAVSKNGSDCFPGLHPCMYHDTQCCCMHDIFGGKVKCHLDGSLGRSGVFDCITYDKYFSAVVAGKCPYLYATETDPNHVVYLPRELPVPQNLTKIMCGRIRRTGTLCGKCDKTSALAVNTYNFRCIPRNSCTSVSWLLYLLTRLGPLTGFYLIVFLFRINAAAPYISLLILQAQIITARYQVLKLIKFARYSGWNSFIISLYSVWNLEVLQIYMPSICLGNMHNLDSLALEYLVALYPLVLVLITYCLAELHARHWWCVFWFFWPLVKLFKFLRINIDPMRSIMNTFATFILLSITKFTVVSINLLAFTSLFDVNGTVVRYVPLFDGDTEYFGGRHLTYAILAIGVVLFCNLLPIILLLLSPFGLFQRCLRWCCCSFRGVHLVNAFLEVFQGHFKDGVSHRRDYRFVAGLQFLLRLIILVPFNTAFNTAAVYTCTLIVFILWTVGGLMVRPYKRELFNILEAILGTYSAFLVVVVLYYYIRELKGAPEHIGLLFFTIVTPGLLFLVYSIMHIFQLCGCHVRMWKLLLWLQSVAYRCFRCLPQWDYQGYMSINAPVSTSSFPPSTPAHHHQDV